MFYDVIIVGAGPAGSACAAVCAHAGLRTVIVEKSIFPREKVCGDCINPACWPVLKRLKVADRVLRLPHTRLGGVEFIGIGGRKINYPLRQSARGEIAVKRSHLDALLLRRAVEWGADLREGKPVERVAEGWEVTVGKETLRGRILVAADGRNSTVARLLGLLPGAHRERLAMQTHIPAPRDFGERVTLCFLPEGYCGLAPVGNGEVNLCVVGRPRDVATLRGWARRQFDLSPKAVWRTITPLARRPARTDRGDLLLVGDVARVVEPFTGEGIYYALATGELAGHHIVRRLRGETGDSFAGYWREHAGLYRGRLWINELSRQAVLHPRLATVALEALRFQPRALRFLTGKVVGAGDLARHP